MKYFMFLFMALDKRFDNYYLIIKLIIYKVKAISIYDKSYKYLPY